MKTQKTEWASIGLPKQVQKRIQKILIQTGYRSVSEYVRAKVINALRSDELILETRLADIEKDS